MKQSLEQTTLHFIKRGFIGVPLLIIQGMTNHNSIAINIFSKTLRLLMREH